MREVKNKNEPYRKAIYGDVIVTKTANTSFGTIVYLKQQQIDFYYPQPLQENIQRYNETGLTSGFFSGDFAVYVEIIKQNKEKDIPLKRIVTYQGLSYDEYDQFVGLAIRYPEEPEDVSHRYSAVWFRDFESAQRIFNITEGNSFPGHIITMKFSTPQYEGHKPLYHEKSGTDIYYVSQWVSEYVADVDYRNSDARLEGLLEIAGEQDHHNYVAPLVQMDDKFVVVESDHESKSEIKQ